MKKLAVDNELSQLSQAEEERLRELGDVVADYLGLLGVEYVFGIPGGAIEPLMDGFARSAMRNGPKCIVSRHETGAAFMAEGYHLSSGKLGVCFATTGPGTTNLVTGVASAAANKVPMLVITAQTHTDSFGRGAFQESTCTGVDTVKILEPLAKYNSLVSHSQQLEHKLVAAVMAAMAHPRGPVHLTIPINVLRSPGRQGVQFPQLANHLREPRSVDERAVAELADLVSGARSPALVLGSGVRDGIGAVMDLAEAWQIPVVTTPQGKSLVASDHPLYRGVTGFAGHASAEELLRCAEADLVIVVAATLGEWASNGWDTGTLMNERMVHVDSSERAFRSSPMARLHVLGNVGTVFERLLARLAPEGRPVLLRPVIGAGDVPYAVDDEQAARSDQVPLLPQRLMTLLPEMFPDDTRYFVDTGNSIPWVVHYLQSVADESGRDPIVKLNLDFAPMGWAIGAAVGSAFANPDRPVVCITGDGSYLMSGQEITVAQAHGKTVIFLVLNDAAYGMVKHGQRLTGAEKVGFELPAVDFAAMAEAVGVPGYVISCVEDLASLDMAEICQRRGPTLLDVRVDREATPPMLLRAKLLKKR